MKNAEQIMTDNPDATVAFGRRLGEVAEAGTVFALDGDLGAGKTQLARGIACGLGFAGRVQSPSFGLINIYEGGRLTMYHLDLYRLETPEEILGAGLDEYLEGTDGVVAVEWASRWFEQAVVRNRTGTGPRWHRIRLEPLSENERRICHEIVGD